MLITPTTKEKKDFEDFVNPNPYATCLQMWEFKEFRDKVNTIPYHRIIVKDGGGQILAAATYSISRFRHIGNVLYVPHVPLWKDAKSLQ